MTAPAPYHSGFIPRFLWGDSLCNFPWNDLLDRRSQFEPVEFLAHTRSPRFICRIVDDRNLSGLPEEEEDGRVWNTNFRFYATDFIFFDPNMDDWTMENIFRNTCVDRQLREMFSGAFNGMQLR